MKYLIISCMLSNSLAFAGDNYSDKIVHCIFKARKLNPEIKMFVDESVQNEWTKWRVKDVTLKLNKEGQRSFSFLGHNIKVKVYPNNGIPDILMTYKNSVYEDKIQWSVPEVPTLNEINTDPESLFFDQEHTEKPGELYYGCQIIGGEMQFNLIRLTYLYQRWL